MKLYFEQNGERCMCLATHKQEMEENNEEMRTVFLAEIDHNKAYFYCQHYAEVGEKGGCGKSCDGYAPRNGINGICKYQGYLYNQTDIKKVIINKFFTKNHN